MLDQNTDRMWFVIGAVIVGAAIIFIANGTLPEIFARVRDSFEETSAPAEGVIQDISPNVTRKEEQMVFTLDDMHPWMPGQTTIYEGENAVRIKPDESFSGGLYFEPGVIKKGVTYSLEFDMTKLSGDILGIGGHLMYAQVVDVFIDGSRQGLWDGKVMYDSAVEMTNEWVHTRQYPNDNAKHHIEVRFTAGDLVWKNDAKVYLQPNRAGQGTDYLANGLDYEVLIENLVLYRHVNDMDQED